jgi:non-heme chloroperoxidase
VPEAFFELIVQESCKRPTRVWKAMLESSLQEDFLAELRRIKTPALLVWGDRDGIVPRTDQEEMLALINGSRLTTYDGAGHAPHWEEPDRFGSDLVKFIETLAFAGASAKQMTTGETT